MTDLGVIFKAPSEWDQGVVGNDADPFVVIEPYLGRPAPIVLIAKAWGREFADGLRNIYAFCVDNRGATRPEGQSDEWSGLAIRAAIEGKVREDERDGDDCDDGPDFALLWSNVLFAHSSTDFALALYPLFDAMGVTG